MHALHIYAKHSMTCKGTFSQLIMLMRVQEFLAGCLFKRMPLVNKFMCSQKYCQPFAVFPCVCPEREAEKPEKRSFYTKAVIASENDYAMKFETSEGTQKKMPTLIHKTTGEQLVTSEYPRHYLFSEIMKVVGPKHREFIDFTCIDRGLKTCEELTTRYYLTHGEMLQLTKEPLRAFKEAFEQAIASFQKFKNKENEELLQDKFEEFVVSSIGECFSSIIEATVDNSSTKSRLPNRNIYLRLVRSAEHSNRLCVHSGELFHAVKSFLIENSAMMSQEHWYLFNTIFIKSIIPLGWQLKPAEEVAELLNMFPLNPGRFHFVPDIDCVFSKFTEKASEVNGKELVEEKQKSRKQQKRQEAAERKKQRDEEKAAKELKKAQRVKELKEESMRAVEEVEMEDVGIQTVEVREIEVQTMDVYVVKDQTVEDREAEELINDLVAGKVPVEALDIWRKELKTVSEAVEKLVKDGTKKANDILELTEQVAKKDKEIKDSQQKISKLTAAKDREVQLRVKIEKDLAEKKVQSDALQKENKALREALRIGKQQSETKEKEQVEKINELQAVIRGFDESKEAFTRMSASNTHLAAQNRSLLNSLQTERELVRRLYDEQRAQLEFLSPSLPPTPSSSGSVAPSDAFSWQQPTLSPLKTQAPVDPPSQECGICLNNMSPKSKTTICEVCSTKWHTTCIEQWVKQKSTCPVCSRSLPSPSNFPPLQ